MTVRSQQMRRRSDLAIPARADEDRAIFHGRVTPLSRLEDGRELPPTGEAKNTAEAPVMETDQVRYFLALCREQSFTAAAKRCGISQPSLTNAIKRLERELGGELFHRGFQKTNLSELGQAMRPHFEKLAQCIEDARTEAARLTAQSQRDAANGARYDRANSSRRGRYRAVGGIPQARTRSP
jgi:molybdenum-dependent DNA-binding transcriptional regulator ModE